jgi:hypothetical protein
MRTVQCMRKWWTRLLVMFWIYEQVRKELLEICTHNAISLNVIVAELRVIGCLAVQYKTIELEGGEELNSYRREFYFCNIVWKIC